MIGDEFIDAVGILWQYEAFVDYFAGYTRIIIPYAEVEQLLADIAEGPVEVHPDGPQGIRRLVQTEAVGKL